MDDFTSAEKAALLAIAVGIGIILGHFVISPIII